MTMPDMSLAIDTLSAMLTRDYEAGWPAEDRAELEAAIAHLRRLPSVLAELERLAAEADSRSDVTAPYEAGRSDAYEHAARLLRGEESGHE